MFASHRSHGGQGMNAHQPHTAGNRAEKAHDAEAAALRKTGASASGSRLVKRLPGGGHVFWSVVVSGPEAYVEWGPVHGGKPTRRAGSRLAGFSQRRACGLCAHGDPLRSRRPRLARCSDVRQFVDALAAERWSSDEARARGARGQSGEHASSRLSDRARPPSLLPPLTPPCAPARRDCAGGAQAEGGLLARGGGVTRGGGGVLRWQAPPPGQPPRVWREEVGGGARRTHLVARRLAPGRAPRARRGAGAGVGGGVARGGPACPVGKDARSQTRPNTRTHSVLQVPSTNRRATRCATAARTSESAASSAASAAAAGGGRNVCDGT